MGTAARAPLIALGASLGLIVVYLAFGGATYEPVDVADPCEQRSEELLASRDLFETLALSGLDGAACELGISREALTLALADESATAELAETLDIEPDDIDDAVRAGLERAVDDAAAADEIGGLEATILGAIAERAPVGPLIDALRAAPGDASIQDLLERFGELRDLGIELPDLSLP